MKHQYFLAAYCAIATAILQLSAGTMKSQAMRDAWAEYQAELTTLMSIGGWGERLRGLCYGLLGMLANACFWLSIFALFAGLLGEK